MSVKRKITAEETQSAWQPVADRLVDHAARTFPYLAPECWQAEVEAMVRQAAADSATRMVELFDVRVR